jgi:hypothetical protein
MLMVWPLDGYWRRILIEFKPGLEPTACHCGNVDFHRIFDRSDSVSVWLGRHLGHSAYGRQRRARLRLAQRRAAALANFVMALLSFLPFIGYVPRIIGIVIALISISILSRRSR